MTLIEQMIANMRLAGLADKTVAAYTGYIRRALPAMRKPPHELSEFDIKTYLNDLYEQGAAGRTMIGHLCALKFLFKHILRRPFPVDRIARLGQFNHFRARVLTRDEVRRLIASASNQKYKLAFALAYSAGLRVSEVCRLRRRDIDFDRKVIFVDGKGGRTREAVLSDKTATLLKTYLASTRPSEWLFPGGRPTCNSEDLFPLQPIAAPINIRILQYQLKKTKNGLRLAGRVSMHLLRHSFATHLIEDGMSIFSVQRLLGHRSIRSTLTYLHDAKIPVRPVFSPHDRWDE